MYIVIICIVFATAATSTSSEEARVLLLHAHNNTALHQGCVSRDSGGFFIARRHRHCCSCPTGAYNILYII